VYIKELRIKKFRLFRDTKIKLGQYITAIAGFNATGKSTILGLLGHCGELKGYKPLLQKVYRTELNEILKFSDKHDDIIPEIGRVIFDDVPIIFGNKYPSELLFRSTKQRPEGKLRYRIIPKRTSEWRSSGKVVWPTLYLGLARLYPLGESDDVKKSRAPQKLLKEDIDYILTNMKRILSLSEDSKSFTIASISETQKKKAIGLNTDTYDYLSNSAGQDNLGQILMTVLSFMKLKAKLGSDWHGGLLVVDELDAALHPLAQNKLVDFLYKQAKDIGIQLVFTTHSLSMLQYICEKTEHNDPTSTNNYELVFLSNANDVIEVIKDPSFDTIYKDLMVTYSTSSSKKVPVFSEDEESRTIINKILKSYSGYFKLLEVSFGKDQLLKLLNDDYANFSRYIYIFDGDVDSKDIGKCKQKLSPNSVSCLLKLPGEKRPEEVLWDYIVNLSPRHDFFKKFRLSKNYTKRSLKESGPLSEKYTRHENEREKYKYWFKDNLELIDDIFYYWYLDNKDTINQFIIGFIDAYNIIAHNHFLPIIRKISEKEEVIECLQPPLL
jgi:AAA15 family ATPase/GTPase